jgi:L-seryl-tRNA(Ser) seleniumtransferase
MEDISPISKEQQGPNETQQSRLRALPQVSSLALHPRLSDYPDTIRTRAARIAVDRARARILAGTASGEMDLADDAVNEAFRLSAASLGRVLNLTGVILHTGLGRARLAKAAVDQVAAIAGGYANVEFELDSGKRGDRQAHVAELFCEVTGAEAALVVNNAAAGVVLALAALAEGREVILSRGQMVEIGGSFRMPDIVRQSGCKLVEVGCTNKTRVKDYEAAVGPETGAILRCHPSNFAIIGFAEEPSVAELSVLAGQKNVPMIDDQGSGLLVDTLAFGMPRQPTVQDSLRGGADVVVASCDKLLGGPQGGMLLGSKAAIRTLRTHPIARAFRVDKLTLAALEATLRLYASGREAEIPTLRSLGRELLNVKEDAQALAEACGGRVEAGITEAGSGSAPGTGVPTYRVGLDAASPDELAARLRALPVPIIPRIERETVWLDPRPLQNDEVVEAVHLLKHL